MLSILKFGFPALLLMLSVAGAGTASSEMNAAANDPTSRARTAEGVTVEDPSAVGARGIILAADKKIQRRQVQPRAQQRMMRARPRGNSGTFSCNCSTTGKCSAVVVDGSLYCEKGSTDGCTGKCTITVEMPSSKMRFKQ